MGASRVFIGPLLSIVVSVLAGIGLAVFEGEPGNDTGVTAVGLALAALVAVLLDGSGRLLRAAAIAVLVAIWIPILEIAVPGSYGPAIPFALSAIGAVIGWVLVRGLARLPGDTAR